MALESLHQIDAVLSGKNNPMASREPDYQGEVSTFFGKMKPLNVEEYLGRDNVDEATEAGLGAISGLGVIKAGKAAKPLIEKGIEYLHPEREAERFRSSLGEGTSSENIKNIGQRIKFAKESAKEEALIPKREIYSQEGKSNVYEVGKEHLPEGNLPKMAEMIEPGVKFNQEQNKSLSKAILNYRKTGNIESFVDHAEDIFNIPGLPEKAISQIEDSLLIPTTRKSAYLSEKEVTYFYGKRGLKTIHDAYVEKPTLSNYDILQSALKDNIRKLMKKEKKGSLDTSGEEKLEALKHNVKNLNADKEAFMKTLPEKMQNLENTFRTKYAQGVGKFEDAPLAMRKLAEGKWQEVTNSQIDKLFSHPTKETLQILKDLGPSVGMEILYNALQKVKPNDAKGIADTLLELKRTKGYDKFITPQMEEWANGMIKQIGHADLIKKALISGSTAGLGGIVAGPVGAVIGAGLPFAREGAGKIAKYFKK